MAGVTLQEVDQALADVFSGLQLQTLDKGIVTVPVLQEFPATETDLERAFPSITVLFMDESDFIFESEGDGETISVDSAPSVPVSTVRDEPEWFNLSYQIHTLCLGANEDREMFRWIRSKLRSRDTLLISGELYWIFRENFVRLDENEADRRIYHKVWEFRAVVPIDDPSTDREVNQVTELQVTTNIVERRFVPDTDRDPVEGVIAGGGIHPIDEDGDAVDAVEARVSRGRTVAFNQTEFWFPDS
jgi:hypothetical protein